MNAEEAIDKMLQTEDAVAVIRYYYYDRTVNEGDEGDKK